MTKTKMTTTFVVSLLLASVFAVCCADPWVFLERHGTPPPDKPDSKAAAPSWGEFVQKLDHFNPLDNATWKQRYLNNSQFFKAGGPLLVFLCGEWEIEPEYLQSGQVYQIAQNENGYMFYIEHRYYGKSQPTKDWNSANLKYLSADQALEDFAHFLNYQKSLPTFKNSKVIAVGASYSANLATWLRIKFPHLVDIAYSSSGPLLAKADFYEYMEVVTDNLQAVNKTCTDVIKQAISTTEQLLKTPAGVATVGKAFKVCNPSLLTKDQDKAYFFETIAKIFSGQVQSAAGNDLSTLCSNLIKGGADPFNQLANYVAKSVSSCIGGYDDYLKILKNTVITTTADRQWTYQLCTEFGYFRTTSKKQAFGNTILLPYYYSICRDAFGTQFTPDVLHNGISRTNIVYGSINPKGTYILSTHGSADPWYPLGVSKNLTQTVQTILVKGESHSQDILPSSNSTDPPQLVAAKLQIQTIISKWLKEIKNV